MYIHGEKNIYIYVCMYVCVHLCTKLPHRIFFFSAIFESFVRFVLYSCFYTFEKEGKGLLEAFRFLRSRRFSPLG